MGQLFNSLYELLDHPFELYGVVFTWRSVIAFILIVELAFILFHTYGSSGGGGGGS